MGYRTVVILNNDLTHHWEKDPELGRKIFLAAAETFNPRAQAGFQYGTIGEQVHCDTQTLAVVDSLSFKPVVREQWVMQEGTDPNYPTLGLLRSAADKLGYRLVRKTK